jgi:hypothetical protein
MLRWDRYGFRKKHAGTRYNEFGVLHPVGTAGHVVHSSASVARNINALFFMLRWTWWGFSQKTRQEKLCQTCVFASSGIYGSCGAFRCVRGMKHRWTFPCSGGPGAVSIKTHEETLHQTCVFASGGICGSRSAFRCVQGTKH